MKEIFKYRMQIQYKFWIQKVLIQWSKKYEILLYTIFINVFDTYIIIYKPIFLYL